MLEYKCKREGAHLVAVDPEGPTKECASCGVSTDKPLWVREHSRPSYWVEADRDANFLELLTQRLHSSPPERTAFHFSRKTLPGVVRIRQTPEYAGMYITGAVGAVMYVARIKEIVPVSEALLSRSLASSTGDQAPVDQNTRVGVFEPESLSVLPGPILLATRVPYRLRYTDLESFRTAETTDDIL